MSSLTPTLLTSSTPTAKNYRLRAKGFGAPGRRTSPCRRGIGVCIDPASWLPATGETADLQAECPEIHSPELLRRRLASVEEGRAAFRPSAPECFPPPGRGAAQSQRQVGAALVRCGRASDFLSPLRGQKVGE